MKKYEIVLLRSQENDFLNCLQDLGLVDITTTGWEPDERERELMLSIDRHRAAIERLKQIRSREGFAEAAPYGSPAEAWENYLKASQGYDELTGEITGLEKEASDISVWGSFDTAKIEALEKQGVILRFFSAYTKEFQAQLPEWSTSYVIAPIKDVEGTTYFVVVTEPETDISINAQEIRRPSYTAEAITQRIAELHKERSQWETELDRAASSIDLISEHTETEKEFLQISQVTNTSTDAAEGTLVVMEGWATKETEEKVDRMMLDYPNLFYIKSDPTPQDETPTLLKNNKFNSMFEFIGNFYSLPKYGTMDLTMFYGPFYALFFGLCLADAGYGLLFVIAGFVMRKKLKPSLHGIANLAILAGASTVVCGIFLGSFFGIPFTEFEPFANFHRYVLKPDNLFILALGIGVFQILFAMVLKIVSYTRQWGFRYALSTLGWMIVIISSLTYLLPPMAGMEDIMGKTVYLVFLSIGLFMMLFLNSPGKNPFVNFGAGLWNTYNDVTGLLGDVLSYIRLFAIGLAGGTLASVFNQLALGLSPDIPVVKQIVVILILLIGHGINLFMSTLSSFVHPMRLTFVEFYKNAGFEATMREFTPLKRNRDNTEN